MEKWYPWETRSSGKVEKHFTVNPGKHFKHPPDVKGAKLEYKLLLIEKIVEKVAVIKL